MKIKLSLTFLILISFQAFCAPSKQEVAARRFNKLFRFIAKHTLARDVALYSLLSTRCSRYVDEWYESDCSDAVLDMIKILDYDVHFPEPIRREDTWNTDSFVFVAFKKSLVQLLSSKHTSIYLSELSQGLSGFLTGENSEFNIWEMSVQFFGNKLHAAKMIATLFQDTSLVKLHLAYLDQTNTLGSETYYENFEKLSAVIDSINMILDYSEDNFRSLFYPKNLQSRLKRNLYHFYVPLYLSLALESQGVSKKYSLLAPVILNLTYEFITSAPDYRYLFKDPERILYPSSIDDMYAGFSGALYGIGKKTNPVLLNLMNERFSSSTKDGVELILQWAN